ncbi:MAG: magnesium chelatase ATPase subunit [Pseudomonadota bacterium]|jgi:magnesium chelatase subunit I
MTKSPYPFSALVGQAEMQLGLLIAAVDPMVGGVLILGHRGTGKSTAVRALADVLPPLNKRAVPVVDLPLGATEDRILGSINLERLLATGEKIFEPGLLSKAHQGFLYVDEINLLEDHLVDLLIDVAASGESRVEREGLSVVHPAAFVLVGSGNPEEGELRPQLLDRFGLSVEVRTPTDLRERVEVVVRREAYDRDPEGFATVWADEQAALRKRILAARKALLKVKADEGLLEAVAKLCMTLGTDGLRGELALLRASKAYAALHGQKRAGIESVRAVAPMVLRHRLRRDPLDDVDSGDRVQLALEQMAG